MSLINQDIKNLVSGISQQPSILRHPEQLEEQINGFSSEAGGLQKRPPSVFTANLGQEINTTNKPMIHFINRDENEKYIVIFTGAGIEVFDLEGNKKNVVFDVDTKNYVYTQSPRSTLKVITIADYTFVTNTQQITKMSTTEDAATWNTQGLLVNIKSGQYGRTYKIVINGSTVASYETPDGSDKSHTAKIATDYIASQLAAAAQQAGYSVVTGSSWLYITKTAYKTVTGKIIIIQPSTTPAQQEDRFKGLTFTHTYHNGVLGLYCASTTVSRNGWTITVTIPQRSILKDSEVSAYDAMIAEINRCKSDYWTVSSSTGTAYYLLRVSSNQDPIPSEKTYPTEIYTLTYTSSSKTPSSSQPYSLINTAAVYDGYNNQAAFGILQTVQKFSNLPSTAPDGFTVKVVGEEGSNTDDYYVVYDASEQVWKETVRPKLQNNIDVSSMPHVLIRQADGSFRFKTADWTSREIGDEDSNPLPSFIDNTINDIFYYRNRLGFLSGENVILTRSADFFNFWMASATKVQDTDPIDLAASDSTISTLYNAVPFDVDLILFSREAQFCLTAEGVLTPTSATLTSAVTHYEASLKAKPVNAGRNVYFVAERAKYSTVREFFTAADNTDSKDVQDITSHVPNLIPNGVYKIIPSTVENMMLYLTEGDEKNIYVYKYLFIDSQRVQAAWSKWNMQDTVWGGAFIDSYLYLIMSRNNNLILERMSFNINATDYTNEPYRVLLDSKRSYTIAADAFDPKDNTTTIDVSAVFGDTYDSTKQYSAIAIDGTYVLADNGKIVFNGDYSNTVVSVGINYNFKIIMSTIMVKQTDNNTTQALTDGRLQLRQMWFNYSDSGYFKVTVDIEDKKTYNYIYTSRLLGTRFNILGEMPFTTGSFRFPIQSKNDNCAISLETDAPLPVALVGAGWTGNYQRRSRLY